MGTGESLGEERGDITGDEYGAGLLLVGLRTNDFSFSGFTLPYTKKITIITIRELVELRDRGFTEGWAPGKLTGYENDFAQLV